MKTTVMLALFLVLALTPETGAHADNKVMGRIEFIAQTKSERSAGVWVDGQYVGFVGELKGKNRLMLLPGDHQITIRQSGYAESTQQVTIQPGELHEIKVELEKDPHVQYPAVTSEVKLKVQPDRAAVFLDGQFVGYVHEFGGLGRAMLVAPGKHQIKIALVGYRDFTTDVNLQPNQPFTLKTTLVPASADQADPAVKRD
ncbi:MAG TPA: PEGA domain-containing protein [Candidatus Cybelea sp.]|nr:PEGA domain-containing protein [Candidatus Cybelea sp.]